jgi:hypothetical protein
LEVEQLYKFTCRILNKLEGKQDDKQERKHASRT